MTHGPGLVSMTGFGAAQAVAAGLPVDVEVRAVNGRHLKVGVRVPDALSALAPQLEELVRERLARGAVQVQVRLAGGEGSSAATLDVALLKRLHAALSEAARDVGAAPPTIGEVALLPGVVRADAAPPPEALWPPLKDAVCRAVDALAVMRRQEGAGIGAELKRAADEIAALTTKIEALAPAAVKDQVERLRARVEQLLVGAPGAAAALAPHELARELALLADRSDIREEVQRLRSHVQQLRATVDAPGGPAGRKLEFLAQELLREANTMASKTHDGALVQHVLAVKLLVEQIREQVANVE